MHAFRSIQGDDDMNYFQDQTVFTSVAQWTLQQLKRSCHKLYQNQIKNGSVDRSKELETIKSKTFLISAN